MHFMMYDIIVFENFRFLVRVHNNAIYRRLKDSLNPAFFGVRKRSLRVNGRLKRRKKKKVFKNVRILVDEASFYVGLSTHLIVGCLEFLRQ